MMILSFLSCKTKVEQTNQNINRKWMLVQLENFSEADLTKNKCFLDLIDKESATAKMGCNILGFNYTVSKPNKIKFSKEIATIIYCENINIETIFSKIIETVETYKLDGQKLYLKTSKNKELIFVAEDWD